ncbi:MAG: type II secretion system protein GspE [Candidatus Schekmanbacteria bacterium GWA2_38_9]|uniref:protein-secreting ATPase n=1 Tax=Candidatus Schekmanbacteria bacterium RIFCSPLOWO2_12_FULL_38_15 TaxID=1817883 RepID=A0A1F7SJ07_9BACT|nr:MAG: type II secretion system protein GspE [Candidatus Schekmanbacteria bacterium GWA2_38_9]OGL47899.1 MAG: type II secretion system protein GspE [Candidatus Schekmanbacteria bacterium RIFCSPLOWO2_02_FULL_38_14]OGL53753.1 MAG: type II secretion system protein GspE [Candidatus Schekmanbacteria bacterium RIFCSPLOWO2_12_FULL_38_15]
MNYAEDLITEILSSQPGITQEQIEKAIEEQSEKGGRLADNIAALGYMAEIDVLRAIGEKLNIPFLPSIKDEDVDSVYISKVPLNYLKNNFIFPLKRENGSLFVATADPFDTQILDNISLYLEEEEAKPVICPKAEITDAINRYYHHESADAEQMIKDMDEDIFDTITSLSEEPKDLLDISDDAPIIKLVNVILFQAVKKRASDIHIEPFEKELRVRYRIDGILYDTINPPVRYLSAVISRIKIMANLDIAEKRLPHDGRIKIKIADRLIDIRVSIIPTAFGERVVMRLLDKSSILLGLEDVGLFPDDLKTIHAMIKKTNGIILVTGPTGSGKTTTLYAALTKVNTTDKNIITIEDPIEYQLFGIGQIQVNTKIELTFARGLRSILRQDPDIIMVGEIRDVETAEIAIHASLTGHLVFSTLHTNDAAGAVTRLLDMGVEPFLVSSTLSAVIAQRLVRVICNDCKESYVPDDESLSEIGIGRDQLKDGVFYRGRGCPSCVNTGYRGRIGIFEILKMDEVTKKLVLEKYDSNAIKKEAVKNGMLILKHDGARKVIEGLTTIEEVLRVAHEE